MWRSNRLVNTCCTHLGCYEHVMLSLIFCCMQVESKIGHLAPATFHIDARCPDGVVRSLCLLTISSNPNYGAELMTPYKTSEDSFAIGPTRWCVRGLQPCPIYEDVFRGFVQMIRLLFMCSNYSFGLCFQHIRSSLLLPYFHCNCHPDISICIQE